MIISHKHKYVFVKPKKVAGTSVEVALSKHLGPKDIMPPLTSYSKKHDKDRYVHIPQNYSGFYDHEKPVRIKQKIGEKMWKSYFKFTIVRNPWDLVVSSYFWEINKNVTLTDYLNVLNFRALLDYARDIRKLRKPKSFEDFVFNLPNAYKNTDYYFSKNGRPYVDYFIIYRNLEKDFVTACKKINVKPEKLFSLKSKTRTSNAHYSKFYNKRTEKKVAEIFHKEISFFNYKFEVK